MNAHGPVHRALHSALRAQWGPSPITVLEQSERPWASATFNGARHGWSLLVSGPDPQLLACRLAKQAQAQDYAIPGHLVADLTADVAQHEGGALLRLEALTVEVA